MANQIDGLKDALVGLDMNKVIDKVKAGLNAGVDPMEMVKTCRQVWWKSVTVLLERSTSSASLL